MGIVKMFMSLQWRKSTLCLKTKCLLPLETVLRRLSIKLFVEILQNYAKKPVLESLF